jgi:hypothetical protein
VSITAMMVGCLLIGVIIGAVLVPVAIGAATHEEDFH